MDLVIEMHDTHAFRGQCCRRFSSKYIFSRHLILFHQEDLSHRELVPSTMQRSSEEANTSEAVSDNTTPFNTGILESEVTESTSSAKNVTDLACKFICQAKSQL